MVGDSAIRLTLKKKPGKITSNFRPDFPLKQFWSKLKLSTAWPSNTSIGTGTMLSKTLCWLSPRMDMSRLSGSITPKTYIERLIPASTPGRNGFGLRRYDKLVDVAHIGQPMYWKQKSWLPENIIVDSRYDAVRTDKWTTTNDP